MKKVIIAFYLVFITLFSFAQKSNSSHRSYTVQVGDGWFSIARKFDLSLAELRLANKNTDEKLKVGQTLVIPAPLKNNDPHKSIVPSTEKKTVSQSKKTEKVKIHTVSKSETLYSISKKYNVDVNDLKAWNKLKTNYISLGRKLIIHENGAVEKVKEVDRSSTTEVVPVRVTKAPEKVVEVVKPIVEKMSEPEVERPARNEKAISRNEDEHKTESTRPVIFANGRKEVNEMGVAAWIEDEEINPNKYYALHRTAPVGTIIKVTNKMNSRVVYVKVVGKLPSTGDNDGILIKISKAGAEKLGVLDERFQAELVYGTSEQSSSK